MNSIELLASLAQPASSKMVMLIMDGLGGLPHPETGLTELETANTPNLDELAAGGTCGLSEPIGPGITPGSGPAHLALFGYDPVADNVGRGVLSALGVDFPLQKQDLAARINFATIDAAGKVTDRRAGRIPTELNRKLCQKLREIKIPGIEIFVETESGHRAVAIFRGENLSDQLADTDPQITGVPPLAVTAISDEAGPTAAIVNRFIEEARQRLADDHPANMVLLRGFAKHPSLKTLPELYGIRCAAIAVYPMYRGLGRLVGMDALPAGQNVGEEIDALERAYDQYDFFFVHVKPTDTNGEDGNFAGKVAVIEEVDRLLPRILDLKPDVLVVTGDHSTPALLKSHSWHPVPFVLSSNWAMPDETIRFGERACANGRLGVFPARTVMAMMLAHALRLKRFGA